MDYNVKTFDYIPDANELQMIIDKSNLSKYAICKNANITYSTLHRILKGSVKMKLSTWHKLASVLDLDINTGLPNNTKEEYVLEVNKVVDFVKSSNLSESVKETMIASAISSIDNNVRYIRTSKN